MAAASNYVAYYPNNPTQLYEYNWQLTFGSMFRDIFVDFPFDFRDKMELVITDERAQNLPLFTFLDFSLWDMFLWFVNFSSFLLVVFIICWIFFLFIRSIWRSAIRFFEKHSL